MWNLGVELELSIKAISVAIYLGTPRPMQPNFGSFGTRTLLIRSRVYKAVSCKLYDFPIDIVQANNFLNI